jgi:hypothetical protein
MEEGRGGVGRATRCALGGFDPGFLLFDKDPANQYRSAVTVEVWLAERILQRDLRKELLPRVN